MGGHRIPRCSWDCPAGTFGIFPENNSPINPDGLVKSKKTGFSFIPAKAGIYLFQGVLDPGFRRGDGPKDFLRDYQPLINWKKKYCNKK
jgi:hypothetical protein